MSTQNEQITKVQNINKTSFFIRDLLLKNTKIKNKNENENFFNKSNLVFYSNYKILKTFICLQVAIMTKMKQKNLAQKQMLLIMPKQILKNLEKVELLLLKLVNQINLF